MPFPATPNIKLVLPIPTVETGPAYAELNNGAFERIDAHDHSPGNGVPIRVDSIDVDRDFSFEGFNILDSRSVRLADQGAPLALGTDISCLYSVAGDLYFNDGAGNQVRITVGGAIDTSTSGSISGMGSTTASVAYSSLTKTFSFRSDTSEPAILSTGTLKFSPVASDTFAISLTAPALSASYALTLPAAPPAATKILTMGSDGTVAAVYDADNSSLEVSGNALRVKAGGVTNAMLATANVVFSSYITSFSTTSTGFVTVTGLGVTITTSGRPIIIGLHGHPSLGGSIRFDGTSGRRGRLRYWQDGTGTAVTMFEAGDDRSGTSASIYVSPGSFTSAPILLPAGTYSFSTQIDASTSATTWALNIRMYVYEM